MSMLHVFQGNHGTGRAVTANKSGAALPALKSGEWEYIRFVNVSPGGGPFIGADSAAVFAGVAKDGYYLWP